MLSATSFADSHDTISSPLKIKTFLVKYHFSNKEVANSVDTSLDCFQQYLPTNKWNQFYANLGNIGQAAHNIESVISNFGYFNNTAAVYSPFLFNLDSTHYYTLSAPYTNIMYSFGQTKENFLDLIHSQQVNQNWNLALNFRIINSLGLYKRQKSDISNFSFQTNYSTENKRLQIWANYIFNKIIDFENGGIVGDSLFVNNIIKRRDAMPIAMLDARNEFTQSIAFVKSIFSLNPIDLDRKVVKQHFFPGGIQYEFRYDKSLKTYVDNYPLISDYPNYFFSTSQTYEKNSFEQTTQSFSWIGATRIDSVSNFVALMLGFDYTYNSLIETYQRYFDNKTQAKLNFQSFMFRKLLIDVDAKYSIGDYNKDDYFGKCKIEYRFKDLVSRPFNLALYGQTQQDEPMFFFQRFIGNHALWYNNFLKTTQKQLGLEAELLNTHIQFEYQNINHPIYLNANARPEQYASAVDVFKIKLVNHLKIKGFGMTTTAVYQNISDVEVMPLPEYLLNSSVGYTLKLFKVLSLNPGIEITYASSYFPEAYSPYLNQFYLQSEYQSAEHVYIDVFLNFKVKRMMLFLKYQHLSSSWMGYDYMMTPHYPMQDAALKFGVKWNFFD